VGYLAHVSLGQMGMLRDRELLTPERIETLEPHERAKLEQLQEARRFGESLGLTQSTSFRHLLDRKPDQAVRIVVASPPDRLEAVTWWFPIVGRVSYRGYFDPARAESFAADLAAGGYDTYVRPAPLYSTLGWFDDPVPRPMLGWSDVDVVDTTLHELVHATVFVSGDTAYNEALATFVGNEGTLRFFASAPEQRAEAERIFADRRRFAALVDDLATSLGTLYAEVDSVDAARREREAVFREFQVDVFPTRGWQTTRYRGFPDVALSNAYVVAHQTYLGELDCFAAWLAALDGDLEAFIAAHREEPGARRDDLEACAS